MFPDESQGEAAVVVNSGIYVNVKRGRPNRPIPSSPRDSSLLLNKERSITNTVERKHGAMQIFEERGLSWDHMAGLGLGGGGGGVCVAIPQLSGFVCQLIKAEGSGRRKKSGMVRELN